MYSITHVLKNDKLTPAQKIVYLYLQEKAQNTFNCLQAGSIEEGCKLINGTALKEIVEGTALAKRTVVVSITALEELGLVKKIPQVTDFGGNAYSKYIIFEIVRGDVINIV